MSSFVFNPGNVLSKQASKPATLRTCFFRYCSLSPDGNGNLGHQYGVVWFLNLAFSCFNYSNDPDPDKRFKLLFPFGHELDGDWLGTPEFPVISGVPTLFTVLGFLHTFCPSSVLPYLLYESFRAF